jgi:hexosaminidase
VNDPGTEASPTTGGARVVTPRPALVPAPQMLQLGSGEFVLDASATVTVDAGAEPAAELLRTSLRPATGLAFPPAGTGGTVRIGIDPAIGPNPEAHTVDVTAEGVRLMGASPAGARHAVQTLRQLLPAGTMGRGPVEAGTLAIPQLQLSDAPAFGWRGGMLDVARHFLPVGFVLEFLDLLAQHKFNVLHLHLTDDQGWRLPVHRYPRLTEVGGWRPGTMVGHCDRQPPGTPEHDGIPHGGSYSRAEIGLIVSHATDLGIMVVPEIDLPGHTQAAIAAYPELGNFPDRPVSVRTGWGISTQVMNMQPSTVEFCRAVLDEVVELFPAPYVHLGGDECPRAEWRASDAARQRVSDLGLESVNQLQGWFLTELSAHLAGHGRRMIGWDEILDGGAPQEATVMSWRNEQGGITATRAGLDAIMAPNPYTYFDHYQADPAGEPLAIGGLTDIERVYSYRPTPAGLESDAAQRILGSQFQAWTEYMSTPAHVQYMAFPRACALAEVLWTGRTDPEDFVGRRLPQHLRRLAAQGVNYRR